MPLESLATSPLLVIACGAIAKEVIAVQRINNLPALHLQCLDAKLHNYPLQIAGQLKRCLDKFRDRYQRVFLGYGDCGSGGAIDRLIEHENSRGLRIERLPGAHCYQFYAGTRRFESLERQGLGSFYLTDFLARHFERLLVRGLQLDRHPQLKALMFKHYKKVVYLSQTDNEQELQQLLILAQKAAGFLGFPLEHIASGYGELGRSLKQQLQIR